MAGKNRSSDYLDGQFWKKFEETTKIFKSDVIGSYCTEVLGWNQDKCNVGFIKKEGSSAFCKLYYRLGKFYIRFTNFIVFIS